MKELLSNFYDLILKVFNNENYINIISIVVVAFTSYHVARYSASKPEKLKIKQLQFKNVYLPLFRILSKLPDEPTPQQVLEAHEKISNILNEHYELVFPQLHKLNNELQLIISHGSNPQNILSVMSHQVEVDYELLKKSLGYPSENFLAIFMRMTFKQKMVLIVSWINVVWLFALVIIFALLIPYLPQGSPIVLLVMFALVILFLFIILKINKWVSMLND